MSHCHRCNGREEGFLRVELYEYCFKIAFKRFEDEPALTGRRVTDMKKPLLPKKQRLSGETRKA